MAKKAKILRVKDFVDMEKLGTLKKSVELHGKHGIEVSTKELDIFESAVRRMVAKGLGVSPIDDFAVIENMDTPEHSKLYVSILTSPELPEAEGEGKNRTITIPLKHPLSDHLKSVTLHPLTTFDLMNVAGGSFISGLMQRLALSARVRYNDFLELAAEDMFFMLGAFDFLAAKD